MSLRRGSRVLAVGLMCTGAALLAVGVLRPELRDARTEAAQQRLAPDVPAARQLAEPPRHPPATGGERGRAATVEPATRPVARAIARAAAPGEALAVLRIPRFGASWSWVAVEGTTDADLAKGPGHYTGTPLPGRPGNVAFAAHRAGHGDPFLDFDRLRPKDRVYVSQPGATWVYRIDSSPRIVPATATWVLRPLPGRRLTLTTCWPKYGSAKRMYVRAHLVRTISGP